jgi:hypothetical protein
MKKQRRPQKPKAKVRQVQELRRSNAAQPHRNKSKYNRKNQDWERDYV